MSAAASTRRSVLMRASAGTGKTFQLSNRYLQLVAGGAAADEILASTFTRKAAGEILDRVLVRLARAALDDSAREDLTRHVALGSSGGSSDGGQCLRLLKELIGNLHRLRICTLDSFFAQVAVGLSLELGLPPAWRIVDEVDDAALRGEAIQAVLRENAAGEVSQLMHLLTKGEVTRGISEQMRGRVDELYELFQETDADAWDAVRYGKTLTVDQEQAAIDALAAVELPEGKRWISGHGGDLGRAQKRDWDGFIAKGIAAKINAGEMTYYRAAIPDALVETYRPLLAHAKAVLVGQLARQAVAARRLLEQFDGHYQRLKNQRGSLRFDDVTRAVAAAGESGLTSRAAFRLDGDVSHLLLDEFQDTSLAQWRAVLPLARRVAEKSDSDRSLFCVGDVKQAIYGWRGGNAEIFETIPRELPAVQEAEPLVESFRSSPVVIDTVNRVFETIAANPILADHSPAAADWGRRFLTHSVAPQNRGLPGFCQLSVAPAAAAGEDQQHRTLAHAADLVRRLHGDAPRSQIGVLVRTNNAVARLIHELRQRGVYGSEEGGIPLTDSPAVQVILALLHLADHPGDRVSRFHVCGGPLAAAVGLADYRDDASAAGAAHRVRARLLAEGYGRTLYGWTRTLAPSCGPRDLRRLLQLVELGYEHDARPGVRTAGFAALVASRRVADPTAAPVRVMTVHQAKGLQFDAVVLPQLDKRLIGQTPAMIAGRPGPTDPVNIVCGYPNEDLRRMLPAAIVDVYDQHLDRQVGEALCVLYVALTRPVHALHMIVAPSPASEKAPPKTFAGLLRAALTDGQRAEAETVLYEHEHNDTRWFETPGRDVDTVRPAPTAKPDAAPLTVRLAGSGERRRRGLLRQSPSGMEGGSRVRLAEVMRLESAGGMAFGTLIHAWFEQIAWLDDGTPEDAVLRQVAAQQQDRSVDADETLVRFREMLTRANVAAVLARDYYLHPRPGDFPPDAFAQLQGDGLRLEVRREHGFALRDADCLLTGSIDRLVYAYRADTLVAADVIDFKTDAVASGDAGGLEKKLQHYAPQLAAYCDAVSKITGLSPDRVSGRLVFVGPGEVRAV